MHLAPKQEEPVLALTSNLARDVEVRSAEALEAVVICADGLFHKSGLLHSQLQKFPGLGAKRLVTATGI